MTGVQTYALPILSAAKAGALAKPANSTTVAAEIAVLCNVFIDNSLLFEIKKGRILIACRDHEGRVTIQFRRIPLINANAPI